MKQRIKRLKKVFGSGNVQVIRGSICITFPNSSDLQFIINHTPITERPVNQK